MAAVCPECGVTYSEKNLKPEDRFQCECGLELQVPQDLSPGPSGNIVLRRADEADVTQDSSKSADDSPPAPPADVSLVSLAVARKLITKTQGDEAVKQWRELKKEGEQKPLADLLVERHLLTGPQAERLQRELEAGGKIKEIGGFRIVGRIGKGGMGAVYKAVQVSLEREVALKILPKHLAKDPAFIERFMREAKSAAQLQHPNIVQAIDVGRDRGYYYFAMEFVRGRSIGDILSEKGRLPLKPAVRITAQVARALEHAWTRAQMIHRDIKPDNILIAGDGTAKLADMGLAKSAHTDTGVTVSGAILGTPRYLSPEQAEARKDIDARADIYSLGCTLFHMVAGRPPFEGDTATAMILAHVTKPPPDVRAIAPDVPEPLAIFLMRMMAKDPAERPQTPTAVAEFLEAFAAGEATMAACAPVGQTPMLEEPDEESVTATPFGLPPSVTSVRRRPKPLWRKPEFLVGAGVTVLLLLLVLAAALRGPDEDAQKKVAAVPPTQQDRKQPKRQEPVREQKRTQRQQETPPKTFEFSELQKRYSAESGWPLTRRLDLGGGVTMKLVLIPPGDFMMGSKLSLEETIAKFRRDDRIDANWFKDEHPRHRVRITRPFYIGMHEVTNAQYRRFKPGHHSRPEDLDAENQPVVHVSWEEAAAFCRWLSERADVPVRLPTESQWEYAARAGTETLFNFGDNPRDLQLHANYADKNSRTDRRERTRRDTEADDGYATTAPVGSFPPNRWGLHDMHGNVWEFCQDWLGGEYYASSPVEDPEGPSSGTYRVTRGGGHFSTAHDCRSAKRRAAEPTITYHEFGFRVVALPKKSTETTERRPVLERIQGPPTVNQRLFAKKTGLPITEEIELGDGLSLKFVLVPPGKFMMGAPDVMKEMVENLGSKKEWYDSVTPQHEVRIQRPFYISANEVTVGQFKRFIKATGYTTDAEKGQKVVARQKTVTARNWREPGFAQTDEHPVVCVSWNDARIFCAWLDGKVGGRKSRLPTEAEWEYAARAGTLGPFYWGRKPQMIVDYANVGSELKRNGKVTVDIDDRFPYTAPAGSLKPNPNGLHDMTGNVWEWCVDAYDKDTYRKHASGVDDPLVKQGQQRVRRGGSWASSFIGDCTVWTRDAASPEVSANDCGFRVFLTPPREGGEDDSQERPDRFPRRHPPKDRKLPFHRRPSKR